AHGLGDVHPATMDALERVRDDATLDEGHRRVHEERMEGELTVVHERLEDGLRDRADPHLHRGAVGHERRDVVSDRALDTAEDGWRVLRQWRVHLDPRVDLAP